MNLKKDEITKITLKTNGTNGYLWSLIATDDFELMTMEFAQLDYDEEVSAFGGGSYHIFTIKSLTDESFTVVAIYKRFWEKNVLKTKTFEYN